MRIAGVLLFCVSSICGQTRLADDQVKAVPLYTAEEAWCPSPVFYRDSETQVTVGRAWSSAAPCFVHFNLVPPAGIDPISAQSFTAGTEIRVTQPVDDELYVYFRPPAYVGSQETRAKSIVVLANNPSAFTCTSCVLEQAPQGVRIFPQFSVPVGMLTVSGGRFHPAVDDIVSKHQLYIGIAEGVVMRRDGTGFWMELSRAAEVAQQQTAALEQARMTAMLAALEPPPSKRQLASASVQAVEQLAQVEMQRQELVTVAEQARTMALEEVYRMMQEMQELRTKLEQIEARLDSEKPK